MSDQEILNKRNISALDEAAKQDRVKIDELTSKVASLQSTVTMQSQQLQQLQQQVAVLMATSRGRGSTS